MVGPTDSSLAERDHERSDQDPDVEPEGPVLDVPDAVLELLGPRQVVASVDLRPFLDLRSDLVPARIPRRVAGETVGTCDRDESVREVIGHE
jgi:hypothetical protein